MLADHHRIDPMVLYECYWASGRASGTVQVWATSAEVAVRTIREHASMFGLPHQNPIVGHPTPLSIDRRPEQHAA